MWVLAREEMNDWRIERHAIISSSTVGSSFRLVDIVLRGGGGGLIQLDEEQGVTFEVSKLFVRGKREWTKSVSGRRELP